MIYLIDPKRKQYKANLHCHSTLSDGRKTPEELKEMYKGAGYSILAITDHERPTSHVDLSDGDFMLLTGYEAYIRPALDGRYDVYAKEVHLNLFARDPENVRMICYDDRYSRYVKRDGVADSLVRVGSSRPREFTSEYINEYIRTARENGYLVAYNHPYWSMQDEAEILSYEGIFSLEICNYGSYVMNGLEHCAPLYEKMLLGGKRVFCHGADDNHNGHPVGSPLCDSFGAFTMISPEKFSYDSVISAMEAGDMYASMGPTIRSLSVEGDTLHVECSEAAQIFAYFGSKRPAAVHAAKGEALTSVDLKIDPLARFVRVAVRDAAGAWANTRAYSREEVGLPPLES